jgi:hypothetical protein
MKFKFITICLLFSLASWSQNKMISKKEFFTYFEQQAKAKLNENAPNNKLPLS